MVHYTSNINIIRIEAHFKALRTTKNLKGVARAYGILEFYRGHKLQNGTCDTRFASTWKDVEGYNDDDLIGGLLCYSLDESLGKSSNIIN